MAVSIRDIKLSINEQESSLGRITAKTLGIPESAIQSYTIKRISLDARKKNDISFIYALEAVLSPSDEAKLIKRSGIVERAEQMGERELETGDRPLSKPVVVVGLGPGGLFAAYTLAKYGYKPIVIERGEDIDQRTASVEKFWAGGGLNCESNPMFGEGGAGAFSDGKLTTRIKDPRAHTVVDILADHGAPERIRVMAKPHIGTDLLVKTVKSIREDIVRMGGEVRFSTCLRGIDKNDDGSIAAVRVEHNGISEIIPCCACVLAIGQGARDTYQMLHDIGLELTPKAFAVGVRIEHPRELIDRSQYGEFAGHPRLGAAEYHLADKSGDRGVYTFCMCPGGVVVASSSGEEQVVTNGMSRYARDEENSNAAVVVQVDSRDYPAGPLGGMLFQQQLERAAFFAGGGDFTAPAERVGDFLRGNKPGPFGDVKPTYRPGVCRNDLYKCLPDFVAEGVKQGISAFGRRLKGFDMDDAVITAVESRTSSPVRIMRDGSAGCATRMAGLYPVGEGAGYAGGIVSAAVDGMQAAERIIAIYKPV